MFNLTRFMQRPRIDRRLPGDRRSRSVSYVLAWMASAVLVGASVAGCGGSSTDDTAPKIQSKSAAEVTTPPPDLEGVKSGGALRFSRNLEPTSLDPAAATDNGSAYAQLQIYDQLTELEPGKADPQPGLAESWTQSPDGLSYTFTLRDAKFSDGTPVTAEDVKFSIDRFRDPKVDVAYAPLVEPIRNVSVGGESEITIELSKPFPALLDYLSLFAASILPKSDVERLGKRFGDHPIGSGPFMVKRWERGQVLELVRNPNYWEKGVPYLDSVAFKFTADDNARILAVRAGQADVAEQVPFSQIEELDRAEGVRVTVQPVALILPIFLYSKSIPALGDVKVRQALNYATPKEQINKAVLAGKAEVANSIIPKLKFWDKDVPSYGYDVAKAKELISQSSVPNGFNITLSIVGADVAVRQIATIVQSAWRDIGVKVKIEQLDAAALGEKLFGFKYQAAMFTLNGIVSDIPVEDEQAAAFYVYSKQYQGFFSGVNNEEVTRMARKALVTPDDATRRDLYGQIQRITMQDAQNVPLFFVPQAAALRDDVRNFRMAANGSWDLRHVWLER